MAASSFLIFGQPQQALPYFQQAAALEPAWWRRSPPSRSTPSSPELYAVVAEVLAYAYRLKQK